MLSIKNFNCFDELVENENIEFNYFRSLFYRKSISTKYKKVSIKVRVSKLIQYL